MTKEQVQEVRNKQKIEYLVFLNKQKELAKPLLQYDIESLEAALRLKVVEKYEGAVVVTVDPFTAEYKYLGTITSEFSVESIFNPFSQYGSEFNQDSIWNKFGQYGGEFSQKSPFNEFSSSPPSIVLNRKVIGYLTVNQFVNGAVDPLWLKNFFVYK
jgi:hypothetical protein